MLRGRQLPHFSKCKGSRSIYIGRRLPKRRGRISDMFSPLRVTVEFGVQISSYQRVLVTTIRYFSLFEVCEITRTRIPTDIGDLDRKIELSRRFFSSSSCSWSRSSCQIAGCICVLTCLLHSLPSSFAETV